MIIITIIILWNFDVAVKERRLGVMSNGKRSNNLLLNDNSYNYMGNGHYSYDIIVIQR